MKRLLRRCASVARPGGPKGVFGASQGLIKPNKTKHLWTLGVLMTDPFRD